MTSRTCTDHPRTRRSTLAVATSAAGVAATAVLLLGLAAPASALATPRDEDRSRPVDGLTIVPPAGGAGTAVEVRAACASHQPGGSVFSPAFAHPATLRLDADGDMVAEATVTSGLTGGHRYVVTANCSATESLTSTFVHTDRPRPVAHAQPVGPVDAGLGGAALREAQPVRAAHPAQPARAARKARDRRKDEGNGVGRAALAFGGGLATAALAGYLLTARRTAAHRATEPAAPAAASSPTSGPRQ